MTRARSTISVSFLCGEARRQSVLDCLHLHPEGMTGPQLSAYLAAKTGDTKAIDSLLKSQIDLREIYYTGQRGKRGRRMSVRRCAPDTSGTKPHAE